MSKGDVSCRGADGIPDDDAAAPRGAFDEPTHPSGSAAGDVDGAVAGRASDGDGIAELAEAVALGKSSAQRMLAPTGIRPPQIVHRARRFAAITLTGSTR